MARTALSSKPRIDAKALRGDVGNFWTPVRVDDDGSRAFSLSAAGFRFDRLAALLLDFRQPPAMNVDPGGSPDWRLVARGVAGGQGKTHGYHERTDIVLAAETVEALRGSGRRDDLAELRSSRPGGLGSGHGVALRRSGCLQRGRSTGHAPRRGTHARLRTPSDRHG